MLIYCVRHGETLHNADGRIQGQTDSPLSPRGQQQCAAVAERMKSLGIDLILSSPLGRAMQSATAISKACGVPIETDDRLMEINAGLFQGKCWPEINKLYPEAAERWRSHDADFRLPEGESRRDLMVRSLAALQDLRKRDAKQVVVVAHGGLLCAALKAVLDIPAGRNPFSLHNGSISEIDWVTEAKLMTLNDISHLAGTVSGAGDL